jgi:hypothetical protein
MMSIGVTEDFDCTEWGQVLVMRDWPNLIALASAPLGITEQLI